VEKYATIVIERVLFERNATMVYGRDVKTQEIRPYRLDRFTKAVCVDLDGAKR
jgi:hypothetical protein